MSDLVRRNLLSLAALALLALLAVGSVDTSSNSSKPNFGSTTPRPYTHSYAPSVPSESPTPDLSLLQITKHTWEKGGFDTVALWHITFWNRSDKPIGNIRYRTRYMAETGDQVDRAGSMHCSATTQFARLFHHIRSARSKSTTASCTTRQREPVS